MTMEFFTEERRDKFFEMKKMENEIRRKKNEAIREKCLTRFKNYVSDLLVFDRDIEDNYYNGRCRVKGCKMYSNYKMTLECIGYETVTITASKRDEVIVTARPMDNHKFPYANSELNYQFKEKM